MGYPFVVLREEIAHYTDADGLVAYHPTFADQRNASGNGLLLTSLYYLLLAIRGEAVLEDRQKFLMIVRSCFKEPGLLMRGPVHPDQEAHDDYTGVCAAARELVLTHIPAAILTYGRSQPVKLWGPIRLRYFYNNVNPGSVRIADRINWNAWLGRMPQVICHFQFSRGEKAWLRRPLWIIAILIAALKAPEDQDAWLLSWLLVRSRPEGFFMKLAARFWISRMEKHFPNGVREIVGRCLNTTHPIYLHWPAGGF